MADGNGRWLMAMVHGPSAIAISHQPSAMTIVRSMLAFDMPPALTRDDAARIAALAQLDLSDDELDTPARQLGDILAYAEQVQQIDTTGVAPTASIVTRHAADRPDELQPSLDRDTALANAPDPAPDAGPFKVPRVLG